MFQKNMAETPAERAHQYRVLAETAECHAAETPLPALRAAFLRSADRWHRLAALMELGCGYTPRKITPRAARRPRKANLDPDTAKPDQAARAARQPAPCSSSLEL